MDEGKQFAFSYYLPMREAVVRFCKGHGQNRDAIVREIARARDAGGVRGDRIARDNSEAFGVFVDNFYPKVSRLRRDLLRQQRTGCQLEGLTLEGGPHLEVTDVEGQKRHVFLHAANWSKKDLDAYLELLGVIIEACYGGDRSSLWALDLKKGKEIKWRSSPRVRKRCRDAAKLYVRLICTVENPEEE